MRVIGLAWLGIPAGDSRPVRFFGETPRYERPRTQ